MITLEKVRFYQQYGITQEEFIRNSALNQLKFTKKDWLIITQMVSNIILTRVATKKFKYAVKSILLQHCDSDETRNELYGIAKDAINKTVEYE